MDGWRRGMSGWVEDNDNIHIRTYFTIVTIVTMIAMMAVTVVIVRLVIVVRMAVLDY